MAWRVFGQAGKGGGARRPQEVNPGRMGPVTPDNAYAGPRVVYGPQPIAVATAQRLFVGTSLTSPMVRGRFRPQLPGKGQNMAETTDLGPLQSFRGAFTGAQRARLNAQAGPSSQPGYPSTNADPTVLGLGAMDLPDIWRV